VLTLLGFVALTEGVEMFRPGTAVTGESWTRQAICPLRKELCLEGYLGVEPRGMGSLGWRPPWLGEAGRAPFFNYTLVFALQLRKSTENLRPGNRLVLRHQLRRLGRLFRSALDWPAEVLSSSVASGWLEPALGRHKCHTGCRTKGFPHRLTSSQCSHSMAPITSVNRLRVDPRKECESCGNARFGERK
jgi:hypothetical protein